MILDGNTGAILHNDGGDELRHPASLTKMMTLYLTFETLASGRLKMSDRIEISEAAAGVAPSKLDLEPGQTIAVSDAIKALITKSANDIAVALSEKIGGSQANFVNLMNSRAREIGMSRTHFENASGLPDPEQVTTARDMITLALHLQDDYPDYYPLFATRTFTYGAKAYRNHNTLLNSFAGIDGIKTGYTRASGFNLVSSVRRNGRHLVGAVFGGSSAASRNGEMRGLLTRMMNKASAVKSRKPAPQLIAKLQKAPKPAERKAKIAPTKSTVAEVARPTEQPRPSEQARPFARQAAVEEAPDYRHLLDQMAKSQPSQPSEAPPVEVAQADPTPVQMFKVRQVSVTDAARAKAPATPDDTTDMAAADPSGEGEGDASPSGNGRTDFGIPPEAAASAEGSSSLADRLATRFADATDTMQADSVPADSVPADTEVPKLVVAEQRPAVDNRMSMLGASDLRPTVPTASPEPAPEPPVAAIPAPEPQIVRGNRPSTLNAQATSLKTRKSAQPQATPVKLAAAAPSGGYEVQIGAYGSMDEAKQALSRIQTQSGSLLAGRSPVARAAAKGSKQIFRARFTGFTASNAATTCTELRRQSIDCFVMAVQ